MNDEMISEFQCSGCTNGMAPCFECHSYKPIEDYGFKCESHSAGTFVSSIGSVNLGLPKGFNRLGTIDKDVQKSNIRLWDGNAPDWDRCNIPVWAMVKDGYLFVRTYSPRINTTWVDVVKDGKIPEGAIDVGEFWDEID